MAGSGAFQMAWLSRFIVRFAPKAKGDASSLSLFFLSYSRKITERFSVRELRRTKELLQAKGQGDERFRAARSERRKPRRSGVSRVKLMPKPGSNEAA
ncbi:hypothetical protein [Mesorhizobium sp. ES1-4]|uniref:hypothetical protein n=1 Tax=Mesorhizobium sp. ES1-4 TaxID=2876627 RepID=UPI001CCC67E4|nr:hypothetical protein [Mesorhizobium sp. ES1-4]MBZ9795235.1 hypothetical protein [Mesorhizobium sp. ES1-4]